MIVRQFGETVQSVEPRINAHALTEIMFLRTDALVVPAEEFFVGYRRVGGEELTASAAGDVKDEVEQKVLAVLRRKLQALEAQAGPDAVLLVENRPGHDDPKTRDRTESRTVRGETRYHFQWTVDPPLKLGVYAPADAVEPPADGS